jgi:tetratricopeptide (TPR) repeat protein
MLDRLVESHLLVGSPAATPNALRYGFHDLVRLYAAELDDDIGVAAALPRVLGHWLALAEVADDALPGTSDVIVRGDAPRRPSDAATIEEVRSAPVDWFTAERRNIVRGIEAAVEGGLPGYAWELAGAIRTFAALRSDWDLWQHTHEVALRACRAAGETRGAGSMLVGLGKLKIDRHVVADGPPPELGSALELFSRIGETAGEAQALLELASFHELAGALRGSVQYAERAARTAGVAGNAGLQADASYVHGRALRRDGDNVRAEQVLTRALRGYRQLRKARGEAQATWELAAVRRDADDLAGAETLLDSCLAQLRRIGDRRGQARVLIDLALTRTRLRRYEEAESCLDEAVRLCRVLGERSFLAHAHDAHAQLLLDRGRPSEAADPAAAAQEIWAELGDSTRKQASGELLAAAGPSIPEQDVPGIS